VIYAKSKGGYKKTKTNKQKSIAHVGKAILSCRSKKQDAQM
jgi:hypothetical protein